MKMDTIQSRVRSTRMDRRQRQQFAHLSDSLRAAYEPCSSIEPYLDELLQKLMAVESVTELPDCEDGLDNDLVHETDDFLRSITSLMCGLDASDDVAARIIEMMDAAERGEDDEERGRSSRTLN